MAQIGIAEIKYLPAQTLEMEFFERRDARTMDQYSMVALLTAQQLFDAAAGAEIPSERLAVVFATTTGNWQSVLEFHEMLARRGYVGVNPSRFPNTMLSTPLSRITTCLKAKGPSVSLYLEKNRMNQAVQYGVIQLSRCRCDAMIVLYANEASGCFGLWLEHKTSAESRGVAFRFSLPGVNPTMKR